MHAYTFLFNMFYVYTVEINQAKSTKTITFSCFPSLSTTYIISKPANEVNDYIVELTACCNLIKLEILRRIFSGDFIPEPVETCMPSYSMLRLNIEQQLQFKISINNLCVKTGITVSKWMDMYSEIFINADEKNDFYDLSRPIPLEKMEIMLGTFKHKTVLSLINLNS